MSNIVLTTSTTGTWATATDQTNAALVTARKNKIAAMVAANQTDGIAYPQSSTVTVRDWVDTASAQEFIDWTTTECTALGITLPTFKIAAI